VCQISWKLIWEFWRHKQKIWAFKRSRLLFEPPCTTCSTVVPVIIVVCKRLELENYIMKKCQNGCWQGQQRPRTLNLISSLSRSMRKFATPCSRHKRYKRLWPLSHYFILNKVYFLLMPPVLWRCWLGDRKLSGGRWGAGMILSESRCRFAYGPPTVSCSSKSTLVWPLWYWLTQVVPDKGPLNGYCFCCCILC